MIFECKQNKAESPLAKENETLVGEEEFSHKLVEENQKDICKRGTAFISSLYLGKSFPIFKNHILDSIRFRKILGFQPTHNGRDRS